MKKWIVTIAFALAAVSCVEADILGVYPLTKCSVKVYLVGVSDTTSAVNAVVSMTDIHTGASYSRTADADGFVEFEIPEGLYRAAAECDDFSLSKDNIKLLGQECSVSLFIKAKRHIADICIKEIYCGGCLMSPLEGTYQKDSYVILHNNSASVQYLDGLCFGSLDPYNAHATNIWDADLEYVPVIQAVWQFPGTGSKFPLKPGEDAVVAIYGAIDHASLYPLSVNLNKADYFVCYNSTYFWNTAYHPTPGDKISKERYLDVAIKTGQATAYTYSINSPATVIFRPQGMTLSQFLKTEGAVIYKKGSTDRVVCVPDDWIEDGVEVYSGQNFAGSKKRLHSTVDAGYVVLSATFTGRSVMRRVDEEKSLQAGYEVLKDSNNSSKDFYETEHQSLREERAE